MTPYKVRINMKPSWFIIVTILEGIKVLRALKALAPPPLTP